MAEISVIIVSWNAKGFLQGCLESLRAGAGALLREIIVVDNASNDGSPEMVAEQFPEVKLVQAGGNLGFARANNLGMRHASSSLLALVNSDVVVHPGCLQELVGYLENHPEVGLAGPRILDAGGRLQASCGCLPTVWNTVCQFLLLDWFFRRWRCFSGFEMRQWQPERRSEVEVLSGCFWVARHEAVEEVGGLDETFFFYAEDIDWCKRFRDAGWKLAFVPEATATHFGGGSTSNAPLFYCVEILRANLAYWKKHHGRWGQLACYLLAIAQHGLRLLARGSLKLLGLGKGEEARAKLREHVVCLRWLLTGAGPLTPRPLDGDASVTDSRLAETLWRKEACK